MIEVATYDDLVTLVPAETKPSLAPFVIQKLLDPISPRRKLQTVNIQSILPVSEQQHLRMFAASRLCAAATKSVVRGPSNTFTAAIRYLHLILHLNLILHLHLILHLLLNLTRCALTA